MANPPPLSGPPLRQHIRPVHDPWTVRLQLYTERAETEVQPEPHTHNFACHVPSARNTLCASPHACPVRVRCPVDP
eukprot:2467418-Prymnesium_polylepis.1